MANVHTNGYVSEYTKQQTAMSGSDINLVIGNTLVGNAAGVTYSITREKAPVYSLGSPSPQSFARNKRGIAGSMNMTIYDRSGFYDILKNSLYAAKRWDITGGGESYNLGGDQDWTGLQGSDALPAAGDFGGDEDVNQPTNPTRTYTNDSEGYAISGGTGLELRAPAYADQLPPFDITIVGRNEVGTASSMVIYGCEIVNEGGSQGLNDVGFEANFTYIARDIVGWTPADENAATDDQVAQTFADLRSIDLGIGR